MIQAGDLFEVDQDEDRPMSGTMKINECRRVEESNNPETYPRGKAQTHFLKMPVQRTSADIWSMSLAGSGLVALAATNRLLLGTLT